MLAKRIIPCLDICGGRAVKICGAEGMQDVGNPVELAELYDTQGADELIFFDVSAAGGSRSDVTGIISEISERIFIPFIFRGGIRNCEDFDAVLKQGADKVAIDFGDVSNPFFISEAALQFGSQCVVAAIDVRRSSDGHFVVVKSSGEVTELDALDWSVKAYELGAGEILLTSMDCYGTGRGYDNSITSLVSDNVGIPVIASGGAGSMQHFYDAFSVGKADAVSASSLFHSGRVKIMELKNYLEGMNVSVRM